LRKPEEVQVWIPKVLLERVIGNLGVRLSCGALRSRGARHSFEDDDEHEDDLGADLGVSSVERYAAL
jgi:hypothetical protein